MKRTPVQLWQQGFLGYICTNEVRDKRYADETETSFGKSKETVTAINKKQLIIRSPAR